MTAPLCRIATAFDTHRKIMDDLNTLSNYSPVGTNTLGIRELRNPTLARLGGMVQGMPDSGRKLFRHGFFYR
jgi:hypothetical protein